MTSGEGGDHELDWFGFPVRPDRDMAPVPAVPCPRCGVPFDSGDKLRAHLTETHGETIAAPRPAPSVQKGGGFRRWVHSLAFLPFWFVVPLNLAVTAVLAVAWWDDVELFALGDQTAVAKAWILRLSLLPVTCYVAARVASNKPGR